MTPSLYLCVDCGGSKTSAVVCDEAGSIRGRAKGGPSNFAYLQLDIFISTVRETILAALTACSPNISLPPPPDTFAAAWFGVAGVGSPAAIAAITPILSELVGVQPGPRLLVGNDALLLAAPVNLYPNVSHCVACIAGTGSVGMSFTKSGHRIQQISRAGGWGWILGDEGSGFHVGREAIRQLLMEAEQLSSGASLSAGPPANGNHTLKTRVLEHFGINDVYDIFGILYLPDPTSNANPDPNISVFHTMTREKRLSSLCTLVFSSAFEDGDSTALNVLRTCANFLAAQLALLLTPPAGTASQGLRRTVEAQESVICFGGSLVTVEAKYRKLVLDNLAQRGYIFKHTEIIEDAAATGAIGLAMAFKGDVGVVQE